MLKPSIQQIETFLFAVDGLFPIPLSQKQDLHAFAVKLYEKATICCIVDKANIVSMVAGYTERLIDDVAYVSVVATLPQYQGKGYAKKLLNEFLEICEQKKLKAVHLYAAPTNVSAIAMYKNCGFIKWRMENEPRPNDLHLIYTLIH